MSSRITVFLTSKRYHASHHPIAGLVVQSTRTGKGVVMQPDHPQYTAYLEAFADPMDADENDALCRALLKN